MLLRLLLIITSCYGLSLVLPIRKTVIFYPVQITYNDQLPVELYNSFLAKELEQKRKEEEEQRIRREIQAREKLEQDIKNKKEDKTRLEKEKEKKKETISKYGTKNNFIPFSGKGHRLGD